MTIDVGSDRQLFLDDLFFESNSGIELKMHKPRAEEVIFQRDKPWETRSLDTPCIVRDGDLYRMWYRADQGSRSDRMESGSWLCYAESKDCINWDKPNLGLVEYEGSSANNIVFPAEGIGGFSVKNPSVLIDHAAPSAERYKMIARTIGVKPTTMCGFVSSDGLLWRSIETNPILTDGPFDSHNIVVWDDEISRYVLYLRGTDKSASGPFQGGLRAIRRSESKDFRNWSPSEIVLTADEDDPSDFHLYTNAAVKYHRAARAYLMFPMTLYDERHYPGAPFHGLSDVIFASSRDGISWDRQFREPFIAPGLDERNWCDRNPMMGAGIVETGPDELSMVFQELHKAEESRFRRCTLRLDGFVSASAPYSGWSEFITPPMTFTGSALELNYSTSGGGSIYVELQDETGTPIPGFTLDDCSEIFGDLTAGDVAWKGDPDMAALAGRPAKMRVRMRDADLYAFRSRPSE
jgi:hypothetical protein